ncbi:MAG: hypothetical protein OEZ06_15165 [Myxococcales bacterium]|nr:hypothetical protein [Myxococcales bacterium]
MSRARFIEFLEGAILGLPQHLKAALRLVDDPDIPDEGRLAVAGVLLHWMSGTNTIPGVRGGTLSLVDDVLLLRLAYERVEQVAPEVMAQHREDSPELFGNLADELETLRGYLGEGIQVLETAMSKIGLLKHQGLTSRQCVDDPEAGTALYEEVQAALVDLDLEEDEVARDLKKIDPIVTSLKQRAR